MWNSFQFIFRLPFSMATPSPMGDNYERGKIQNPSFKIFFSRTIWLISTKLVTKHPWVKGTQGFAKKDLSIIKKEMMVFFLSNSMLGYNITLSKCVYWFELVNRWAIWSMGLLYKVVLPLSLVHVLKFSCRI